MTTEERKETAQEAPKPVKPSPRNKPVLTYVVILFLAAFFLMALSLMMHQRSNTETLGEIRSGLSVMQDIQDAQEQIISLQDELASLEEERDALQSQLEETSGALSEKEVESAALLALYTLQQQYLTNDLAGCQNTLDQLAQDKLYLHLPLEAPGTATSPATRYLHLKDAVAARVAEAAVQAEEAN